MTFCMSTTGLAPETVTVSSSAPTLRSAFTVAVKVAGSSMPSRLTVENPGSVKVTVVGAGPEVDDLVLPLRVGGHRPHAFDERGTARLDRHARHHGAARVPHDAGNARRLRERCRGQRRKRQGQHPPEDHPAHKPS